ncbi:MAG: DUF47 family protein [Candidatus Bathyarchaeia archaeon]
MAFPLETEAAIRRQMLDMCLDHARLSVEVVRELTLMLDALLKDSGEEMRARIEKIHELMKQANELKNNILAEVSSVGSLLINREVLLRLIFRMGDINDDAEAIAYRLSGLIERGLRLDRVFLESLAALSSKILNEMGKMREAIRSLNLNPESTINISNSVDEIEREIDVAHRNLELDLLMADLPIHSLLILKDIAEHLERMADTCGDIVDMARVLAVTG